MPYRLLNQREPAHRKAMPGAIEPSQVGQGLLYVFRRHTCYHDRQGLLCSPSCLLMGEVAMSGSLREARKGCGLGSASAEGAGTSRSWSPEKDPIILGKKLRSQLRRKHHSMWFTHAAFIVAGTTYRRKPSDWTI